MAKAPTKQVKDTVDSVLPPEVPATPQVLGYREQHPDTISVVNDHKIWEEQLLRRYDWLFKQPGVNQRTLSIALAHMEISFAMPNKAVFNPARIELTDEMAQMINPDNG